jgi:glycosyltransferase XagB
MRRPRPSRSDLSLRRAESARRVGDAVSAKEGATGRQRLAFVAFLGAIALGAVLTLSPISAAALILSPFYLTHVLFFLGAALEKPRNPPRGADPPDLLDPPRYTVMAPLYREARVAQQLTATLGELAYPVDKLQIILLLEADDTETQSALAARPLPPHFQVLVVPPGGPRTKPNALNHGLSVATGDYLTIFDAEDLPDPDQLMRAACMFEALPADTVCLQARLVIDNAPDGWLPLMMSIEYAALFDAAKCGFATMAMPVALGGTSNHFRRAALVELGGWDAWNVTEDADLGLQIALRGWLVADLPSTTLEEAPITLRAWFSQRRRWLKGFMQTCVSHSRKPRQAIRSMGLVNWLCGMAQVAGAVIGSLLFPIFTAHVAWNWASGQLFDNDGWLDTVLNTVALWVALCGVMSAFVPALIGMSRRRTWHLAPWLATLPIYLTLISAAAWMALVDYLREPFRWLKTEHGLGVRRPGAFRSRRE